VDDERSQDVGDVIKKAAALLVGIAVLIAVGTWLFVKAIGLNDSSDTGPIVGPIQPASPLPSTALAEPGGSSSSSPEPSDMSSGPADLPSSGDTSVPPDQGGNKQLRLSATPAEVSPMERINLTGTYGNRDNVSLEVQRWEDGTWGDFPTSVTVSVGTFATYVQTSRPGVNRFRVFDPSANLASNVVEIKVS
jgi:hypothetical protein